MRRAAGMALAALAALGCHASKADKTLHGDALRDPESCQQCHPVHYTEWSGSMHAYAADDPVFRAMNARGQRETKGKLGGFCVQCHAPIAFRSGASSDGLNLDKVPASQRGVTCFFCHAAAAVHGPDDAPVDLADDEVLRGAIRDPVDNPAHDADYSPLLDRAQFEPSASLCGSCHDIVTAAGVGLERTYLEWQASQFHTGNGTGPLNCGDCHMHKKTPDVPVADFPGVKTRHLHEHTWPGVDVALTPFPQQKEQLAAVSYLASTPMCAKICLQPPSNILSVWLENTTAGHNFPSGAAQDRRVWVEIVAQKGGMTVFSSGVVPPGTAVADLAASDKKLALFRDRLFDGAGNETHMFWDAARSAARPKGFESNLLAPYPDPNHTYQEDYFDFKGDLPDTVTLKVYLQPMGREVLKSLVDSGDLDAKYLDALLTFTVLERGWQKSDGTGCFPKHECSQ